MDSDSDSEIFLTQNSFRNDSTESEDEDGDIDLSHLLPKESTKYSPIVSDVSDFDADDLIAATMATEGQKLQNNSGSAAPDTDAGSSRFLEPVHDKEMVNISRRRLSDSTETKIKWAVTLFNDWKAQRNEKAVSDVSLNISPINVNLDDMTKDELNYSISRFLCEIKKQNGEDYPGKTLYELVICLQLHFELKGVSYKFLSEPLFLELRNTLDRKMQERIRAGVGTNKKQAEIITLEEEELLWRQNVLGSSNPTQLQKTLFHMIGLNFALRGGQEHRSLRWKDSQMQLLTDSEGLNFIRYTENCSKGNQGGLKHRHVKPKVVDAYENKKDRQRCIVTLYKKYEFHSPDKKPDSAFYLRPLVDPKGRVWYSTQPVGCHKLSQVVNEICKEGGLSGYRTNHSLRATAASRLFDEQVDEQLICEVTGHRSNAVRNYKRTTKSLKRKVNALVQGQKLSPQLSSVDNPTKAAKTTETITMVKTAPSQSTSASGEQAVTTKHISLTLNFNL